MAWDWALPGAAQTLRLSPVGISKLWFPVREEIRDAACPVARAGLPETGPGFQRAFHRHFWSLTQLLG